MSSFRKVTKKLEEQIFLLNFLFLTKAARKLLVVLIFQLYNLNREIFAWMIMLTKKLKVAIYCWCSCLAPITLWAVAAPNYFFRFAIGNHVLVSIVQQHFSSFWRLGIHQLFLTQLLTAHHFFEYFRNTSDCWKEKIKINIKCLELLLIEAS